MEILPNSLSGVLTITPTRFGDARGFFCESWNRARMEEHGIDIDFVQDNHSLSEVTGTLRGLHFQSPPHDQAKLVRCGRGSLYDVAVDIRRGSPTYGQWTGVELSFENGKQLLIPEGFLHGFVTLEPMTEVVYKCSDYYNAEASGSVAWDSVGIDWPLRDTPTLSEQDKTAIAFDQFRSPFIWEGDA
ncbi:MAG: dTDP-4-dehydrorhamnose 3,5-epimerase [Litoreibacter sp.]|nr:dTDP-4-dehydrorhamnose 3,5-epimerase [Litoreibacter sp.]